MTVEELALRDKPQVNKFKRYVRGLNSIDHPSWELSDR